MTDSTGTLSETHSSSSNEPTETQLAEAGDQVQVSEPAVGTTIQLVAAGDSLQLNFDPADVAKVEVKDGNLEITFKNGSRGRDSGLRGMGGGGRTAHGAAGWSGRRRAAGPAGSAGGMRAAQSRTSMSSTCPCRPTASA